MLYLPVSAAAVHIGAHWTEPACDCNDKPIEKKVYRTSGIAGRQIAFRNCMTECWSVYEEVYTLCAIVQLVN